MLAVASRQTPHSPMLRLTIPPTSCLSCCRASWNGGKPSSWSAVWSCSACLPHWLQLSASCSLPYPVMLLGYLLPLSLPCPDEHLAVWLRLLHLHPGPGSREISHYFCDLSPVEGLFCGLMGAISGAVDCDLLCLHPDNCAANTFRPREAERLLYFFLPPQCAQGVLWPCCSERPSLSSTLITPMVNPVIYSLKNQEVKWALQRLWGQLIPGQLLTSSLNLA